MKILIIGANGKLGSKIVDEAVNRNHEVTALIRNGNINNKKIKNVLCKNLFDLNREDVEDFDVIISAFGSGFNVDPKINRDAINHLASIVKNTNIHLIMVGGAGALYIDHQHMIHVYETKDHPEFLKGISMNITLGLQDLKESSGVNYTLICPSLLFDYEGKKIGYYQVGTEQEVIYSSSGDSRISYSDFASAMVDEAENHRYINKCITICEV